jgi:rubrerythrin
MSDDLRKLIRQLQGAHAGELAAAFAYRGHWKSLRSGADRDRIRAIEAEELHHRALVAGLLAQAGARPNKLREATFWCIGRTLGALCHVSGWFIPMYGAGRLERSNIVEYEDAAEYASRCGHEAMLDCLLEMAEVEWEHESYFRECVQRHWMSRFVPLWNDAPPKATIRARWQTEQKRVAVAS